MADTFYLTTAIHYPNGKPHIGHAYETIAADVLARFHRQMGREVRFQTGTDEHGLKMAQKARDLGKTPRDLADDMSAHFKDLFDKLGITYDRYIRTTEEDHHRASQAIWQAMEANGDLYLDRYEGWYSVRDEAFYDESELVEGEGGDKLSPQGTPVEWTAEETWFFKLSAYGDKLLALYRDNPDFIRPESRRNEVMRFVEGGLRDLSVSRTSFDWGVPVPGSDGHVMYVWVDALTNYLTGVGYPDETDDMAKFWPADLHLVGKDITRFHTVYWPAFLMSAGIALPRQVYAHGFLLSRDGTKESKSAGNVTDPGELVDAYGVDTLRYFLLREFSFGQDGTYSREAIVNRANSELANSFGNLAQRVLSFVAKRCDGRLEPTAPVEDVDSELLAKVRSACAEELPAQFEKLAFTAGLEAWMQAVYACNAYVDEQAPWALRKTDPERMVRVLHTLSLCIRDLAIAVAPVTPAASGKLLDALMVPAEARDFAALSGTVVDNGVITVDNPQPVFPRLEMPEGEDA
ncbi:methionine--tRNA ligase [Aurantiacibacter gangjinensis]|uniref:Methionine--tRNA ligase n=1 Tax=Aurantiacibacter gangjinensis TaxID=502682 RepID=A0A0G9MQB9_9SPHN|nr:methionine--tRNA ligase [Aurantiacibacter gangjinensis]APE28779.1 Methionyl-tRNA synthetase [Aurantiacibacter gangjinensis]KLE32931.1 methionine--tRNA ligase [Aurantiacibacter gangjinensis]